MTDRVARGDCRELAKWVEAGLQSALICAILNYERRDRGWVAERLLLVI